jgi:hypothetical protein
MGNFDKLNVIRHFVNDGNVCGVYSVEFKGKQEIFVRNRNSIGAVQHYLGKMASECVSEIRDDVKKEFLEYLQNNHIKG